MGKPLTHGFDVKAGKSGRGIDSKGVPVKKGPTGAPGAPNTGTPSYIKQAASSAEKLAKSGDVNRAEHRIRDDWKAGGGFRGGQTRTEKIRGGEAG